MTTIGVEIEAIFPLNETTVGLYDDRVGYHHDFRQADDFPRGWMAQTDSSIHTDGTISEVFAAEIISPVMLSWTDAANKIDLVMRKMNEMEAKTNWSCGFHVHAGCGHMDGDDVSRLIRLARRYEFALYGTAGSAIIRRMASEHGRHYCKTSSYGVARDDRYQGLNLSRMNRGTVEFRMFQGSMIANRLIGATLLASSLVLMASTMATTDIPDERIPSPVEAMEDLLTSPNMPFSWACSPRREAVTATLMRQARKAEIQLNYG